MIYQSLKSNLLMISQMILVNYLNWIGDIPTGRFSIDQRTGYFDKKAYKKISVYLIKEDEKFYEIDAQKSF